MMPRQSFLVSYLIESGQYTDHKKEGGEAEVFWPGTAHIVWPVLSHCLVGPLQVIYGPCFLTQFHAIPSTAAPDIAVKDLRIFLGRSRSRWQ